mmetsp:Transcript_31196/g.83458  ORF Transcript_31196/g.83458 Transcript_31196/m.83458 type:complete len:225 (+) Transcript_31196:79-753(+)
MTAPAAGPRAGRALLSAVLLLLTLAIAEDSDATCKAGEPGCGAGEAAEAPEGEENPCPPMPEEQTAELNACAEGSKQWRWALERLQSSDNEGAHSFLQKGYNKCLKKLGVARKEVCVRGWAEDVVEYRWLKQGHGVSEECRQEAKEKYTSGSEDVEACAKTFHDALDSAEETDDQGKVYQELLQKCAGISPMCAQQNGYMMAERAQQNALKEIGIDTKGGTIRR